MNRDLIVVHGEPGSRSEELCRNLSDKHHYQLFVGHISYLNILRSLHRTATDIPDDKEAYNLISESLGKLASTSLVLLSGYPQHEHQINDLYELAMLDNRRIVGQIVARSPDDVEIGRVITENPEMSVDLAQQSLIEYRKQHHPIIAELSFRDLPTRLVDTSNSELEATHSGTFAVQLLLSPDHHPRDV